MKEKTIRKLDNLLWVECEHDMNKKGKEIKEKKYLYKLMYYTVKSSLKATWDYHLEARSNEGKRKP